MTTDNKTLADVQPGGRVRLGDQAERARFEAWAEGASLNIARLNDGGYCDERTVSAWLAWLSAQPSPGTCKEGLQVQPSLGGQGDAPVTDEMVTAASRAYYAASAVGSRTCMRAALEAALAARQPVGEPLWCLHVLGMDDVHPAPSKAHAEKAAAWHNEQFKDQAARLGISIEAKVVPWPHSAESHAAGVAEFIPQWLIPQWQLDTLEANAAQPAQAVDLGAVREAVRKAWQKCAAGESVDLQFGTLLALIDSQAVGK